MDSTANEVDGLNVRGYPTLIFYGKDDKEGKTYDGGRDFEALKLFIEENSGLKKPTDEKLSTEESEKPVDAKADL